MIVELGQMRTISSASSNSSDTFFNADFFCSEMISCMRDRFKPLLTALELLDIPIKLPLEACQKLLEVFIVILEQGSRMRSNVWTSDRVRARDTASASPCKATHSIALLT